MPVSITRSANLPFWAEAGSAEAERSVSSTHTMRWRPSRPGWPSISFRISSITSERSHMPRAAFANLRHLSAFGSMKKLWNTRAECFFWISIASDRFSDAHLTVERHRNADGILHDAPELWRVGLRLIVPNEGDVLFPGCGKSHLIEKSTLA